MELKRSRATVPFITSSHAPSARRNTPRQFAIDSIQVQRCQQQQSQQQ